MTKINKHKKHDRVYTCELCGSQFCLLYQPSRPKKFCSKQCISADRKDNPIVTRTHKFRTKKQFEQAVKDLIRRKNRYVPMDEICYELRVATSEFNRHKTSIIGVHKELGVKKPVSVPAEIVYRFLQRFVDDIEKEKSFGDLVSSKGMVLRYDFYSEKMNLLVEVDGAIHRKRHEWWDKQREANSQLKNEYAAANGIQLVRVPVTKSHKLTDDMLYSIFESHILKYEAAFTVCI